MNSLLLAVVVFGFFASALATATEIRTKPGFCGRTLVKRELCQCQPHGTDQCDDECSQDEECYGQRKCCTLVCKRVCVLPVTRPTSPRVCPPDQEFNFCPPSRQPTCVQPSWSINITRPSECVPQCVCRPGYVRDGYGRCVKQEVCPPVPLPPRPICPGRYEILETCRRTCQPSCANPTAIGCVGNECVQGCFCAPGYVRNGIGRCVLPSTCPPDAIERIPPPPTPVCPPDQEFHLCYRECEATCEHPKPRGCFRRCQVGCFCRAPFVRDHFGNCVSPDSCVKATTVAPRCVGNNEIYIVCNRKCQGTCRNPRGENCYSRCVTGCFCEDGYVRDENNECTRFEECPPRPLPPPPPAPVTPICEHEYEDYQACHQGCQRTCSNPTGEGCVVQGCVQGCFCQPGLLRNAFGHCVASSQCPTYGCGSNEHYTECGPACPATCGNQSTSTWSGDGNGHGQPGYGQPGPGQPGQGQPGYGQPGYVQPGNGNGGGSGNGQGGFPTPGVIPGDSITGGGGGGSGGGGGGGCDKPCSSGCFCDDGYIRRSGGGCVPYDQCRYNQASRSRCNSYEDSVPCGGVCERDCAYGWSSYSCPSICRRRCCRRKRLVA